jgi:2-polyprenyl-3-methyl-5-hydroxy-6-metoxy-1,4-benzoquinol methylase
MISNKYSAVLFIFILILLIIVKFSFNDFSSTSEANRFSTSTSNITTTIATTTTLSLFPTTTEPKTTIHVVENQHSISPIPPSLIGGQKALISYSRKKVTKIVSELNDNTETTAASWRLKMEQEGGGNNNNICPATFRLFTNDSADEKNIDRRSDWVVQKYKLYASRCAKRNGIMWASLSLQAHDRLASKVAALLTMKSMQNQQRLESFKLLDWGSGCGVGLKFFSQFFSGNKSFSKDAVQVDNFFGLGIDLIEEAVEYARQDFKNSSKLHKNNFAENKQRIEFCQADGTNLQWIPSNSFDAVTAFGALLHIPKPAICKTVSHLLRIVKPNGIVWGGYIDDTETADLLAGCEVELPDDEANSVIVDVTVVSEKIWFSGLGVPKSNLKRNPRSIIWRKF